MTDTKMYPEAETMQETSISPSFGIEMFLELQVPYSTPNPNPNPSKN